MATPAQPKPPGRGFVITGIVMMVVAVLGVVVVTTLLGGSLDLEDLDRDVVVTGAAESKVPGRIGFRIIEDISPGEGDSMTVGVATSAPARALECRILDGATDEVELRSGSLNDSFVSAAIDSGWEPVVVAEGLPAGEYSAVCNRVGEPSGAANPSGAAPAFRVGRVVTTDDMFDFIRPAFGIVAAVAVGGLIGLIGLILMVVGLVIGNRARREPPMPPM